MFDRMTKHVDAPARALMAAIFIVAGAGKLSSIEATQRYMEAFDVPSALLLPTIVFELGAGLLLLVGLGTRYVAFLLAMFTLVSGAIFHMSFADQVQLIMFLKNLAIAGGLLLLTKHGAPDLSIDNYLASRK